ncbi:uncharacterized protein [Lolium perenne]|uniref:uncharacterized protein n=1 Tax=Lolium perenne TaxID=4522 RepID=UPI003A9A43E5
MVERVAAMMSDLEEVTKIEIEMEKEDLELGILGRGNESNKKRVSYTADRTLSTLVWIDKIAGLVESVLLEFNIGFAAERNDQQKYGGVEQRPPGSVCLFQDRPPFIAGGAKSSSTASAFGAAGFSLPLPSPPPFNAGGAKSSSTASDFGADGGKERHKGRQRSEALPECSNAEATTSGRWPCCHSPRSCSVPTAVAASTRGSTTRASVGTATSSESWLRCALQVFVLMPEERLRIINQRAIPKYKPMGMLIAMCTGILSQTYFVLPPSPSSLSNLPV